MFNSSKFSIFRPYLAGTPPQKNNLPIICPSKIHRPICPISPNIYLRFTAPGRLGGRASLYGGQLPTCVQRAAMPEPRARKFYGATWQLPQVSSYTAMFLMFFFATYISDYIMLRHVKSDCGIKDDPIQYSPRCPGFKSWGLGRHKRRVPKRTVRGSRSHYPLYFYSSPQKDRQVGSSWKLEIMGNTSSIPSNRSTFVSFLKAAIHLPSITVPSCILGWTCWMLLWFALAVSARKQKKPCAECCSHWPTYPR